MRCSELAKFIFILFFTGMVTLQFNMASCRVVVRRDLSSAYFPHHLAPIDFRSFSIQSKHLNTLRTGDADLRFYITTVQDG